MSTEIATIKNTGREGNRDLDFTQFAGKRGISIQITQGLASPFADRNDEPGFIQLTKDEAYETIDVLMKWLAGANHK